MSMFNIICRSMHCNFTKLHDYLNSFIIRFDVICLGESRLNASDDIDLFQLSGYNMVHKYSANKKGEVLLFILQLILIFRCLTNYVIVLAISLNVYQDKFPCNTKNILISSVMCLKIHIHGVS